MAIEKRVMLFWHDPDVPEDVASTVQAFRESWPSVQTVLLNDESASDFLRQTYSADYADLFTSCRIPAMRSDLIRYAWLAKRGGIYVDVKYRPIVFPENLLRSDFDLTCIRYPHFDNIVGNSFLVCPIGAPLVRDLTKSAFDNVKARAKGSITHLTGPGLLMQKIDTYADVARINVLTYKDVFGRFLKNTRWTQGKKALTDDHWSVQEQKTGLYL